MRERRIQTVDQLQRAALDLTALEDHLPIVLTVTQGSRIRTTGQNARHWSEVNYLREQLQQSVEKISEHTGYTPLEVKRLIAQEMEPEQIAILYARSNETIHDILKDIVGIPTSTRLGTKEFSKFDDRLAQVMAEIVGIVKSVTHRATT